MARMPVKAFRVPQELEKEIAARGEFSDVVRRDLDRLYTLYRRALARVELTENEAWLVADAMNGTLMDATTAPFLWASVEDTIQLNKLDKKWNVDGAKLVEKLRRLSDIEALAIVDAAERFWVGNMRGEDGDVKKYFGVLTKNCPGGML